MTLTVSVGEFRQNISHYISKAKEGHTILLKDGKKGHEIAQLVGKKEFNPIAFERALKNAAGVFTAENHPEWRTKKDIIRWLRKERLAADRHF